MERPPAMPVLKRPAAGHATTSQAGSATSRKRSRTGTEEYEELACLGEGGFGAVVLARHRVTGKTVAIKRLASPDASELQREARFLDACRGNPYVVGSEGLLRDLATGGLRLVMEYVAGPSLHSFLWNRRHGPPLPEPTVRAFMWKLLTGTKMMHDRHVVHRDIKPDNILVGHGQDGELVKICDLGLAISMSDSPPYTHAGTVPYMAPEMLLQKPDYDALVDTWSLGCVMAEMLTGETLFDDDHHHHRQNEFDDIGRIAQFWRIFRILGIPDDRTWPGFAALMPVAARALQLLPAGHNNRSKLRDIFPQEKLSEQGFQVLQGLLTCNPDKRLTAARALKLPWFAAPRPSAAAAAKVQASPLQRKETPRFQVPIAAWKAQRV
uniref:Uncharacterized protein n=1 Tax=Avena sativa TaxID=4498 RepID=A0ACD5WEH0_AVESA